MKIVLGMSGGVDSAASAYLLQQQGHMVAGVTLWMSDAAPPDSDGAGATAERLGISYAVIDCRAAFREHVLDAFAESYRSGETPNPCVICNPTVKFAALLHTMREMGYDGIATGHYASVRQNPATGAYAVWRGKDLSKDQSYMLYRLTQEQLSHMLLPLGEMQKTEVRALAADAGFLPRIPKDSMDICFVPDGDYAGFLARAYQMQDRAGVFLDRQGQVLGTHGGQWHFTVGQRKGLGLACGKPVYVLDKNAADNTVLVGGEDALFASRCEIRDCCWFDVPSAGFRGTAKIRYSRTEAAAEIADITGDSAVIRFDEPQRAMTRGQSLVFYDGDTVLGGGIIRQALPNESQREADIT